MDDSHLHARNNLERQDHRENVDHSVVASRFACRP